jgi:hypothetical protein
MKNELFELIRPEVEEIRENDTTIHFTLVAMRDFCDKLDEKGLYVDDLDEVTQELYDNLDTTIHIRVFEYTGIDTANFADLYEDLDPEYFHSTLVNDIMQAVFIGELAVQEANLLLSNMDKLDLQKTRVKIDELIEPHFENNKPNDEDFEKLLEQLDEEDDSSELDFSNMV